MNSGPQLSQGSHGDDVRRLQRILVMTKLLDYTGIDANFGPKTKSAVEQFQQGNGLQVDGIVGQQTWAKLPADPDTPRLARGAKGSQVSALQHGLKTFGKPATNPGAIDGDFGPDVVGPRGRRRRDARLTLRAHDGLTPRRGTESVGLRKEPP